MNDRARQVIAELLSTPTMPCGLAFGRGVAYAAREIAAALDQDDAAHVEAWRKAMETFREGIAAVHDGWYGNE